MDRSRAFRMVTAESHRAAQLFTPFNSPHEGFAVLLEEVDELWAEVKSRDRSGAAMREEAVQVAAMALRFLTDCCPDG